MKVFREKEYDSSIDEEIIKIKAGDNELRNSFIESYRNFILSAASRVKGTYIDVKNDDEYSISLMAFNKAIDIYSKEKGSFFNFAQLLIKRSLIDYYRKSSKLIEDKIDFPENKEAEREFNKSCDAFILRQEIGILKALLKEYGIDFQELSRVSPKHKDTRRNILKLCKSIYEDSKLLNEIIEKKMLPIIKIMEISDFSRKTLEKHRKYIISNVLLLSSDLDYIKEYIKDI